MSRLRPLPAERPRRLRPAAPPPSGGEIPRESLPNRHQRWGNLNTESHDVHILPQGADARGPFPSWTRRADLEDVRPECYRSRP